MDKEATEVILRASPIACGWGAFLCLPWPTLAAMATCLYALLQALLLLPKFKSWFRSKKNPD